MCSFDDVVFLQAKEVGPVDIDKIVAERVAQELEKVKLAGAGKACCIQCLLCS